MWKPRQKFFVKLQIALLSMGLLSSGLTPSMALPLGPITPQAADNGLIELVQNRPDRHRPQANRPHRPNRPNAHRPHRPNRPNAHRPGRPGYWNGHRGSRTYRSGWRRHNDGWWYPLAAFTAGAIIGGSVSQPRPVQVSPSWRHNDAHLRWCHNRFRSYRASDNTFQPYNGPRRQCVSPYF